MTLQRWRPGGTRCLYRPGMQSLQQTIARFSLVSCWLYAAVFRPQFTGADSYLEALEGGVIASVAGGCSFLALFKGQSNKERNAVNAILDRATSLRQGHHARYH